MAFDYISHLEFKIYINYTCAIGVLLTLRNAMLQTISVTVDEVRLEVCFDYIKLYDGATTSSSVIGSYCTTPSPSTFASSGSSVLVVFISDYSVSSGKFSLRWTFNTGSDSGEFSLSQVLSQALDSAAVLTATAEANDKGKT